MGRTDKRITVYPSPRATEILGNDAPALNQAIDAWAELIAKASADNDKLLNRQEWCYLADLLNGTLHEPGIGNPGPVLACEVADGNELDGMGGKWFEKKPDKCVADLIEKMNGLDYAHAWAVITSIEFFWSNCDEINLSEDTWWTIPFRREFAQKEKG